MRDEEYMLSSRTPARRAMGRGCRAAEQGRGARAATDAAALGSGRWAGERLRKELRSAERRLEAATGRWSGTTEQPAGDGTVATGNARRQRTYLWSTHLPYSCVGLMLDGPKIKTCSWYTWATTLVALVLGPPMDIP
jgi:hypothetical protein